MGQAIKPQPAPKPGSAAPKPEAQTSAASDEQAKPQIISRKIFSDFASL